MIDTHQPPQTATTRQNVPKRRSAIIGAAVATLSLGSLLSFGSQANAADAVGTVYNYTPDAGAVLGGELIVWQNEVLANRTAAGFSAFNISGGAAPSPIATGAPVKFMANWQGNLLWVDNAGGVKYANPGGSVTTLGVVPVTIDSVTVVGSQLWFTRPGGIDRYQPSGSALGGNTPLALTTPSSTPRLTVGTDGNVWAVESTGGVDVLTRWTTLGAPVGTAYNFANSSANPNGITTGPDGAVWVLLGGTSSVARFDNGFALTEFALPAGANPRGITAGPEGGVWITENALNNVSRLSWNNNTITRVAYAAPSSFGLQKLTTGPDGNIWTVGTNANRMAKLGTIAPTTTTTTTTTIAATTTTVATVPPTAPPTVAPTVAPTTAKPVVVTTPAKKRVCTRTAKRRVKVNGKFVTRTVCIRYKTV
jgi:streptogramin lyase